MANDKIRIIHSVIELPFDKAQFVQVFALTGRGKVVGTANADYWGRGADAFPIISKVWVHPVMRRGGIGRRMMTHLIDLARASDIGSLALYVIKDNHNARSLYESLGFFPCSLSGENLFCALNLKN